MKDFNELNFRPLEIVVYNNDFDSALKKFKMLVQKEGVLALYKAKQTYEKPSVKKRRKVKEAIKKKMISDFREKLILSDKWEKRQKQKELKRLQKTAEKRHQRESAY